MINQAVKTLYLQIYQRLEIIQSLQLLHKSNQFCNNLGINIKQYKAKSKVVFYLKSIGRPIIKDALT